MLLFGNRCYHRAHKQLETQPDCEAGARLAPPGRDRARWQSIRAQFEGLTRAAHATKQELGGRRSAARKCADERRNSFVLSRNSWTADFGAQHKQILSDPHPPSPHTLPSFAKPLANSPFQNSQNRPGPLCIRVHLPSTSSPIHPGRRATAPLQTPGTSLCNRFAEFPKPHRCAQTEPGSIVTLVT